MHEIRSAATRREPHHGDGLAADLPRIARLHQRRRAPDNAMTATRTGSATAGYAAAAVAGVAR